VSASVGFAAALQQRAPGASAERRLGGAFGAACVAFASLRGQRSAGREASNRCLAGRNHRSGDLDQGQYWMR